MYLLLGCQISSQHILLVETRSKQFGSRSITTKVVSQISPCLLSICIDTFFFILRFTSICNVHLEIYNSSIKNFFRACSFFDTGNTSLGESNMVLRVTLVFNERANTLTLATKSPLKTPKRTSPSTSKPNITISGMDHYRQSLVEERISERYSELIVSSRRKNTVSN